MTPDQYDTLLRRANKQIDQQAEVAMMLLEIAKMLREICDRLEPQQNAARD